MNMVVMSKNYLIYGVKRTGNHAIINWLIPQIGTNVRFFNDQKYMLLDLSERDNEHHLVEHILQLHRTRIFVNNERRRSSEAFDEKHNDINNIISFEGIKLNQMLEMENQWLEDLNKGLKLRNPDLVVTNNNTHIVLLRNPWNFVASQIKWGFDRKNKYNKLEIDIEVWNEFYEHYIEQIKSNTHFIIFDKWFQDIEYRKKISTDLGLEFTDVNLNNVAKMGGGSSFDKMTFDGDAQKMNVLNRYQEMMIHKKMQDFIKTDKAIDLKNNWNHLCDLENIKELKIK